MTPTKKLLEFPPAVPSNDGEVALAYRCECGTLWQRAPVNRSGFSWICYCGRTLALRRGVIHCPQDYEQANGLQLIRTVRSSPGV